jgi:4-hydroxysphinganine ceramide fatty acyl 2-hydroxylase
MIFESIEHAKHYASGNNIEIVIYEDKVIEVTEFKEKHPGGIETIEKYIGQDITQVYDKVESHKTKTAMKDLEDFCIGKIKLNCNTKKPNEKEKDYNYELDLQKGILWQVWSKLTKEEYLNFIHDPKHMISPPEAILFETPFLEFFTKTPWYLIPIIWGPVILYNLWMSYYEMTLSLPHIIFLFIFGIFVWTFTEYILHRFVFHIDENLPCNRLSLMLHFLLHGIHHAFPMDRHRLVFPPVAAYPLYLLIKFCVSTIFRSFYFPVMAGVITGYIMYDLTHYYIHHAKPTNFYHKSLKQYHVLHHYANPKSGFGVSNKIWDYVFGTVLRIGKSERQ